MSDDNSEGYLLYYVGKYVEITVDRSGVIKTNDRMTRNEAVKTICEFYNGQLEKLQAIRKLIYGTYLMDTSELGDGIREIMETE